MEVLNFLEWCKRIKQWHSDNDAQTKIINDALFKVYEAERFYSQPFKSEMIKELFEGWEKPFRKIIGNWFIVIVFTQTHYYIKKYVEEDGDLMGRHTFHNPENITLNDFISDCQRAGISLEWKKEIADKYFGGVK